MNTSDRILATIVLTALVSILISLYVIEINIPLGRLLRRYKAKVYKDLAKDPAVIAFDAHKIVSGTHPTKPHVRQTFLRPPALDVFSRMTPDTHPIHARRLHDFQRTGTLPAVAV